MLFSAVVVWLSDDSVPCVVCWGQEPECRLGFSRRKRSKAVA